MDVKPPMVISLAKKEELVYVQARSEPVKLPRNHQGLKMLQYIRDEAHRFAQHYHHVLRRKSQLEEDVAKGKRPPMRRKLKKDPAAVAKEKQSAGEMPFSTIASLPVLQPAPELPDDLDVRPPVDPDDAEETAPLPPRTGQGA